MASLMGVGVSRLLLRNSVLMPQVAVLRTSLSNRRQFSTVDKPDYTAEYYNGVSLTFNGELRVL